MEKIEDIEAFRQQTEAMLVFCNRLGEVSERLRNRDFFSEFMHPLPGSKDGREVFPRSSTPGEHPAQNSVPGFSEAKSGAFDGP